MAGELSKNKKSGPRNLERTPGIRTEEWPSTYFPFGIMRGFADDVNRMFEGFGFPSMRRYGPGAWGGETRFWPELDVVERDGKLTVRADLPGLTKDDVHVDISGNSLIIEGERKNEYETNEEGVYSCERSYGHFRREIRLPESVNTDSAKANFQNGILEVTFDAPETKTNRRRVEIGETATGSKKGDTAA
jgi:HSP20 family protein